MKKTYIVFIVYIFIILMGLVKAYAISIPKNFYVLFVGVFSKKEALNLAKELKARGYSVEIEKVTSEDLLDSSY